MAKKVVEVVVEQPAVEKEVTVVDEANTVDEKAVEVVTTKPIKNVAIHLTEDVESTVAGIRYSGKRDKEISVPSDVAAILVNAKVAYRV